jgi:hypothetical protein
VVGHVGKEEGAGATKQAASQGAPSGMAACLPPLQEAHAPLHTKDSGLNLVVVCP